MRRLSQFFAGTVLLLSSAAVGCHPTQPLFLMDDGDLSHYQGVATELDYPDVETCSLAEATDTAEPLTLSSDPNVETWDLCLQDAIQFSLENSKVMRQLGGFTPGLAAANQNLSPTGQLLNAPGATPTVYNPSIVESDPRFGTEAALSQFDAQFTSSLFWEKNDRPVNLFFGGFLSPIFEQDLGTFQAEIAKTGATGTRYTVRQHTSYEFNNNPSNQFPSIWQTDIEGEFRHPLLQGSGVQFNRIAGPNGISGFYNGVTIARINTDIALADFEAGVRGLVADVERAYWDLYFAYHNLEAAVYGRDAALETWRKVYALFESGSKGGEAEKEALAREQYYLFRGQVEDALSNLYTAENRLRYMMGIAATDGRLIRPCDEPINAQVRFDWCEVLSESLSRSVELRRQRWQVKERELQLIASKNFLLPRLDIVGRYRWRGFGDDLLNSEPQNTPFDNAWQVLTEGNFQEWQIGGNLAIPIGFRQAHAGVRNAELQLARERAVLQEQELELSHQLTSAVRDMDRYYRATETNFNRRVAAERQVKAVETAYDTGSVSFDLLLDAQRRLSDAERAYYRSLVDYNLGLLQVHFRKGSLLEYNNVYLAEGPWPAKAYFDAKKRARERDAGEYVNYGMTRPTEFSQGPYAQVQGEAGLIEGEIIGEHEFTSPSAGSKSNGTERVPTPAPEKEGTGESETDETTSPEEETSNTTGPVLKKTDNPHSAAVNRKPASAGLANSANGDSASETNSRNSGVKPVAHIQTVRSKDNVVPTTSSATANRPSASGWRRAKR